MYDQHTRSLHTRQELRNQFLTYLKIDICEHEDKGNMIILGVDLNDPVQTLGAEISRISVIWDTKIYLW